MSTLNETLVSFQKQVIKSFKFLEKKISVLYLRSQRMSAEIVELKEKVTELSETQTSLKEISARVRHIELQLEGLDTAIGKLRAESKILEQDRKWLELIRTYLLISAKQVDDEVDQLRQSLGVAITKQNQLRQMDRRRLTRHSFSYEGPERRRDSVQTLNIQPSKSIEGSTQG